MREGEGGDERGGREEKRERMEGREGGKMKKSWDGGELISLLPLPLPLVPHYLICVFHIGTAPRSAS